MGYAFYVKKNSTFKKFAMCDVLQEHRHRMSWIAALLAAVLMALLLLIGGIEPNPGPGPPDNEAETNNTLGGLLAPGLGFSFCMFSRRRLGGLAAARAAAALGSALCM